MTTHSTVGQSDPNLADKAAESADAAIQSARQKAHNALDGLSKAVKTVKDQASASLERLRPPLDSMTTYVREEPTKALLIAAAAGAALMGLVALMGRSGGTRRASSSETLRNAARDIAENMRRSARDSADSLRQAARDAADGASAQADGAMKSARSTAKAAYEGLTDTVQQWKDQAAPIVDRIRPQVDTVMNYAKDDPAKALLIAAAAGAALMGLISTITR